MVETFAIFWSREKQQEMTLADMCTEPDKPWEYCPREVFRKVTKILKDEFDLVCLSIFCARVEKFSWSDEYHVYMLQVVNVAFEIEFYLLKHVIRYVT